MKLILFAPHHRDVLDLKSLQPPRHLHHQFPNSQTPHPKNPQCPHSSKQLTNNSRIHHIQCVYRSERRSGRKTGIEIESEALRLRHCDIRSRFVDYDCVALVAGGDLGSRGVWSDALRMILRVLLTLGASMREGGIVNHIDSEHIAIKVFFEGRNT